MRTVKRVEVFAGPVVVLELEEGATIVLRDADAAALARAVARTASCGDDSVVEVYDRSTGTYYEALAGDVGPGTVIPATDWGSAREVLGRSLRRPEPVVLGVLLSVSVLSRAPGAPPAAPVRVEDPDARRLLGLAGEEGDDA